jgi:hypothetical protein
MGCLDPPLKSGVCSCHCIIVMENEMVWGENRNYLHQFLLCICLRSTFSKRNALHRD